MRRLGLSLCTCLLVSVISVINCYGTSTFGTGLDGILTVSSTMIVNNQNTNLSQSVSAGQSVINVIDATLFNVNDNILIIQMLGGETGVYDDVYIQAVDTGLNQLVLENALQNAYLVSADAVVQVLIIPNYDCVIINPTGAITCNSWNNTTGGIIAFKVLKTLTNNGVITASGKGSFGSTGGAGGVGGAGGPGGTGLTGHVPDWGGGVAGSGGYGSGSGTGGSGSWINPYNKMPDGGRGGMYGLDGSNGYQPSGISYPGFSYSHDLESSNISDASHLLFGACGLGGTGGNGGRGAGGGGGSALNRFQSGDNQHHYNPGQDGFSGGTGGSGGNGGAGGGIVYLFASYCDGDGLTCSSGSDGDTGNSGGEGGNGGQGGAPFGYYGGNASGAGGGGDGGNGGNGGKGGNGGAGGTLVFVYRSNSISHSNSVSGGSGGSYGLAGSPGLGGLPGSSSGPGAALPGIAGISGSLGSSGINGLMGFVHEVTMLNFTASETSGVLPFTVHFTTNIQSDQELFYWDFENDGVIDSNDSNPSHTYYQAGTYSVKLLVNGLSIPDSLLKANYISVLVSDNPKITVTPDILSFGNVATNSTVSMPITIKNWGATDLEIYSISPTNSRYQVLIPQGLSYPLIIPSLTNMTVDIAFTPLAVQLYQANLMILSNDPDNNLITKQLIGYGYILSSDFTASPQSGDIPLEVQFTSTSQGDIVSYLWDFGDGQTSNEINPVHIYSQKGLYDVTLTIQDQYTTRSRAEDGFIQAIAHPILTSPNSDTPLSFGIVYLGDTGYQQLIIESTGTDSVYIHNLSFHEPNTAYSIVTSSIPEYLHPGEQAFLELLFSPSQSNAYRDTLYIVNSSENIPLMKIRLDGIGEYVPPQEPQEVSLVIDGYDAVISWEPVTQNIYNTPITVPYYFIYGSVVPNPDNTQQVFLGYSTGTTFRHMGVGLPGSNVQSPREFFYTVTAVVWYPPRNGNILLDQLIGLNKEEVIRTLLTR